MTPHLLRSQGFAVAYIEHSVKIFKIMKGKEKHLEGTEQIIKTCIERSRSRFDLWIEYIKASNVESMAEIGVFKGDFASQILGSCESLKKYYMIDPWRNLEDWNKPANVDNESFQKFLNETKRKTDFASDKRIMLRGKTTEVINEIPDESLDFIYIDGDHTLRGITIDLLRAYPKVHDGGWIGGDDFSRTIWQHHTRFEPTLVFPFAVYFAEAMDVRVYALPYNQFLIEKKTESTHAFLDFTGNYNSICLKSQLSLDKILRFQLREKLPILSKIKRLMRKGIRP